MQVDREELARYIKVASQNAWKVEQNTTLNSMIEHVVREVLNYVLDKVEPHLQESVESVENQYEDRVAALEEQMKFVSAVMGFNSWKENQNGSNEGRPTTTQRNPKAQRGSA